MSGYPKLLLQLRRQRIHTSQFRPRRLDVKLQFTQSDGAALDSFRQHLFRIRRWAREGAYTPNEEPARRDN